MLLFLSVFFLLFFFFLVSFWLFFLMSFLFFLFLFLDYLVFFIFFTISFFTNNKYLFWSDQLRVNFRIIISKYFTKRLNIWCIEIRARNKIRIFGHLVDEFISVPVAASDFLLNIEQ